MRSEDFQALALIPGALDGWWLIACEETGTVRDAFARVGLRAISCDLVGSRTPGPHYQGDVRNILRLHRWRGVIAHPVCRYLTNSGVHWLMSRKPSVGDNLKGPERWQALFQGAEFFNLFADLDTEHLAIENPTMHKYARALIRLPCTQTVQPWMFGHLETKATGLHLRGLPPLVPTDNVRAAMLALPKSQTHRVHYASPGADRERIRSEFYRGIGDAMAVQWGLHVEQLHTLEAA